MADFRPKAVESGTLNRRLPVGAEVQPQAGVHFRLWAPKCQRVALQLSRSGRAADPIALTPEEKGYFSVFVPAAKAGDQYWFLADGDDYRLPDPASRFQPEGPHGPSEIVDPGEFKWHDSEWRGAKLPGQVIYELHLGTFTPEGTWAGAAKELAELAKAGITLIEVMPVAGFPGRFNWGYDGVNLYAPVNIYGRPDDMRAFVDAAHRLEIGVILDVVYNHVGPDGNYLSKFSDDYFTDRHKTDWGAAINFDGSGSAPVREFFIHNAGYWIDEFHLDGLRLDATQNIYDSSAEHVLTALGRHARAKAAGRSIVIVSENEPQEARLVRPIERGGYGLDGLWNDDFHHSALVAARGRNEAYYSDFLGTARELLAAAKHGFIYQGQWSQWQDQPRGTPARGVPPWAFITFLENHDQVSNSLRGLRVHQLTSPGRYRALTALLLLGPGTPLLFQGQEFGATTPFLFFADHHAELAPLVHAGRKEFLSQFPSISTTAAQQLVDDPASAATYERCKLDLTERERNAPAYRLHKDLLRLRREEPALAPRDAPWFDGAVLSDQALVIRYFAENDADERLLMVNLGAELRLSPLPEPLLAPPPGMRWKARWSSEDAKYNGCETPELTTDANWRMLGEAALWLGPEKEEPHG
jgi:maltooligosyltrehalose trehalohydrolase